MADAAIFLARGSELRIVWANEAYHSLLSLSRNSATPVGRRLAEVSSLASVRAPVLQDVMRTGEPQEGEDHSFSVEDGVVIHHWSAYRPTLDHVLVIINSRRVDGEHGEGHVGSDTDILIASQAEARRIMDEALKAAAQLVDDADEGATAVLLEQGRLAAKLLDEQQALAVSQAETAADEAKKMSRGEATKHLAARREAAEILRRREAKVAADLIEIEKALARSVEQGVDDTAASLLMDAHREAAAVLLEARMLVEQRRASR